MRKALRKQASKPKVEKGEWIFHRFDAKCSFCHKPIVFRWRYLCADCEKGLPHA